MGIDIRKIGREEYPVLRNLAIKAWEKTHYQENKDFFDLFKPDYLDFNFAGPREKDHMLYGAYWGDKLVGSIGITSFDAALNGKVFRYCLFSWYTSFGDMIGEMVRTDGTTSLSWDVTKNDSKAVDVPQSQPISFNLGAAAGYFTVEKNIPGICGYAEYGHKSHAALCRVAQSSANYLYKFRDKTFTYPIVGLIEDMDLHPTPFSGHISPYSRQDIGQCLGLLNSLKDEVSLAQVWNEEELDWQLDYKGISETLLWKKGGVVKGLINYLIFDSISKEDIARHAIIDNLHMSLLESDEKEAFLKEFLLCLKDKGIAGAIIWYQEYFDEDLFYNAGFKKENRDHYRIYLSLTSELEIDDIKSTYVKFR